MNIFADRSWSRSFLEGFLSHRRIGVRFAPIPSRLLLRRRNIVIVFHRTSTIIFATAACCARFVAEAATTTRSASPNHDIVENIYQDGDEDSVISDVSFKDIGTYPQIVQNLCTAAARVMVGIAMLIWQ